MLEFVTRLPTRQDGVENRDKVYNNYCKIASNKQKKTIELVHNSA